MDQVMSFVEPGRQFAKDSIRLVKRCTKPDRKGRLTFAGSCQVNQSNVYHYQRN